MMTVLTTIFSLIFRAMYHWSMPVTTPMGFFLPWLVVGSIIIVGCSAMLYFGEYRR